MRFWCWFIGLAIAAGSAWGAFVMLLWAVYFGG
jgi:hypothetical protein